MSKLKIRIHERFKCLEYSGTRNDVFYDVLHDELKKLNRKDVSDTQLRLFADNNYKNFDIPSIINGDSEELDNAIRKLDDYDKFAESIETAVGYSHKD